MLHKIDDLVVDGETTTEVGINTLQQLKGLIDNMKIKFHDVNTSRNEKFQILTLIPQSWSYDDVKEHFQVSKYLFSLSRKLQNVKGIMCQPNLNHKGMENLKILLRECETECTSLPYRGIITSLFFYSILEIISKKENLLGLCNDVSNVLLNLG